jgi:Ca2+-binding RTX toxin-like protein
MAGGPGDDEQAGGPGNDRIFANHGRDVTDGGPGDDDLWALLRRDVTGPGDIAGDVVRGGEGNDRIRVRDGELDVISCGPGADVAILELRRRDRGRHRGRATGRLRAGPPPRATARRRPAGGERLTAAGLLSRSPG